MNESRTNTKRSERIREFTPRVWRERGRGLESQSRTRLLRIWLHATSFMTRKWGQVPFLLHSGYKKVYCTVYSWFPILILAVTLHGFCGQGTRIPHKFPHGMSHGSHGAKHDHWRNGTMSQSSTSPCTGNGERTRNESWMNTKWSEHGAFRTDFLLLSFRVRSWFVLSSIRAQLCRNSTDVVSLTSPRTLTWPSESACPTSLDPSVLHLG